jgi:type I phosphodiesterase/nucleotide pyrophosphatase
MKNVLPLFVFIDALGWEIIRDEPFAAFCAPRRRRLTSVFGYSSACVPSIVSGKWPSEHHNWCYFVYDPKRSPFSSLRHLRWLPRTLSSRRRVRRQISKLVKARLKFRGYFDLYNMPFRYISKFDFSEKKSPLKPGGMNRGTNIFDYLEEHEIEYHSSDPDKSEAENTAALIQDIRAERMDFAFVYWPELDGLLHFVGNKSHRIPAKLRDYQQRIEGILALAQRHYSEVRLYIFGDHGMANCNDFLDLRAKVQQLDLKMFRDYAVVYDSTMARFWFFNDRARTEVTRLLAGVRQGRILSDEELKEMGTFFADHRFGELIFLVKEGVLIVPSDMGERPLRAMHGYHPDDKHSYAALCTNQPALPDSVTAIPHMYDLMVQDAEYAKERNRDLTSWPTRYAGTAGEIAAAR